MSSTTIKHSTVVNSGTTNWIHQLSATHQLDHTTILPHDNTTSSFQGKNQAVNNNWAASPKKTCHRRWIRILPYNAHD